MARSSKFSLPSLERAAQDLEDIEKHYQSSLTKIGHLSHEIEKLNAEKLALKITLDNNKKTITFYQNLQVDVTNKIDGVALSQNKAKLVATSKLEKMKQIETRLKENKFQMNTFDMEIPQNSRLTQQQAELLSQKTQLENTILVNNEKMEELLKKFK